MPLPFLPRLRGAVLALLAAALVLSLLWLRTSHESSADKPAAAQRQATQASRPAKRASSPSTKGPEAPVEVPSPGDTESGFIAGWVVDVRGEAVSDARVEVQNGETLETDVTDEDGRFAVASAPGERWLRVTEGRRSAGPILIQSGERDDLRITLRELPQLVVSVVDGATDRPLPGARVTLARPEYSRVVVTDSLGTCEFAAPQAGRYVVRIEAKGYGAHWAQVTLGPGGEAQHHRAVLRTGASVSGVVLDDGGARVGGSLVELWGPETLAGPTVPFASTRADDRGVFELVVAPCAGCRVVAMDDEHTPGQSPRLDIVSSPIGGLELRLGKGHFVEGRVRLANGHIAGGAQVSAVRLPPSYRGSASKRAVTSPSGAFQVSGLQPGRYALTGSLDGVQTRPLLVDLMTSDVRHLELVLDEDSAITGVVVDGSDEPIGGALVVGLPVGAGGPDAPALSTRSDTAGSFRLPGIARDQSYTLQAQPSTETLGDSSLRASVTARAGDHVRLQLVQEAAIRGEVRLIDGSPPVGDILVSVDGGAPSRFSRGAFLIERVLAGTTVLRITGEGLAPTLLAGLETREGQVLDLGVVTVSGGAALSGHVVDETGAPVSGAVVTAGARVIGESSGHVATQLLEEQVVRAATTDSEGQFVLRGLDSSARPLVVVAEHPNGRRSEPRAIDVTRANGAPLVLVLRGAAEVSGLVQVDGAPARGVLMALIPKRTAEEALDYAVSTITESDGSYSLSHVAAGHYLLATLQGQSSEAFDLSTRELTVEPGSRHTEDFALRTTGNVVLVQVDAARPPADQQLVVVLTADTQRLREIGPTDTAEFAGVPEGDHRVCVRAVSATEPTSVRGSTQERCEEVHIGHSAAPITVRVGYPG